MHCCVVPTRNNKIGLEQDHITKKNYTTDENQTTKKIPYTTTKRKQFTLAGALMG